MRDVLPEGWREVALNTVVKSKSGDSKIIKGKNSSSPEAGLFQGYSATGPDVWVKQANHSGVGIVVSAVGARCGKTFLAVGEWTAIANTHVLLPLDGIYPKFLWYVSNREDWWVKSGTAQPFVKVKDTLERPFPLPPLPEQQRIVEILEEQFSRLDAALASIRTVREKAQAFRRSLLHSAFSGELTGGTEGWREAPIESIADVQLGRQRSPQHHHGPNMRPYLRAANVKWTGIDISDVKQMNFTDEEMETYLLVPDDILLNEASGSASEVGKPAIFKGEIQDCGFQNHLIRIRAKSVETNFLYHYLLHNALSGAYLSETQGVGINHLGKQKIAKWLAPVPPTGEQQRIVEILEEQFSRLDNALHIADQLEARIASERRSLLQSAFTGELTAQWRKNQ